MKCVRFLSELTRLLDTVTGTSSDYVSQERTQPKPRLGYGG